MVKGSMMAIPESLFEHRAVLYTRHGAPISLVNETYKRQLLPDPRAAAGHGYHRFGPQISGNAFIEHSITTAAQTSFVGVMQ